MLYLLLRHDKVAFKLGITKNDDFGRIVDLRRKYGLYFFNFAESYVIKAIDDKSTLDFESQLKKDLRHYQHEAAEKIEGYTEFFTIDALPMVLNYVHFKIKELPQLGITIEKGINVKKPKKKRVWESQKCKNMDSERPHHFYNTIKSILEYKDVFTYYEEKRVDAANNEGIVGVLVSADFKFLLETKDKNSRHYFLRKHNGFVTDIVHPSPYFIDIWEIEGECFTFGALATRVVTKSPSMEEYERKDLKEKENIIVNARMAYFQRICRRELAPTPHHLRVGLEVESGK